MQQCLLVALAMRTLSLHHNIQYSNKTINFIWIQPDGVKSPYANLANGKFDDASPMARFFEANMATWQKMNPSWEIRLWDNAMSIDLVRTHFHHFEPYYHRIAPSSKADLVKLMILIKYAGVYSDLDGVPSKSLDEILEINSYESSKHNTALFIHSTMAPYEVLETATFPIRRGFGEISKRCSMGFLFASQNGSNVLQKALSLSLKRLNWIDKNRYQTDIDWQGDYPVIYSTGPDILSEAAYRDEAGEESEVAVPPGLLVVPRERAFVIDAGTTTWKGRGGLFRAGDTDHIESCTSNATTDTTHHCKSQRSQ